MNRMKWLAGAAALAVLGSGFGSGATAQVYDERPATLKPAIEGWNYERRAVEIPMRDGVKLHTVILIPRGAKDAGILLTRTPYGADGLTQNQHSGDLGSILDGYDNAADVIVEGGYIRVVQDVRGKYGSGGTYVMNRPLAGTDLNPTKVDHATDTYDTIDWLVKHLPESNGRVGIIGISYDGFLPLMALVNPHPALKVSVPMNPMVDGWRGDDWFHNGAFRQMNMPYIWEQVATRDNSSPWVSSFADDYDQYMRAGSAGELGRLHGLDQIGFWRKITQHPAYDAFWQEQAMDKVLAKQPLKVPVMIVHSQWDQEDIYGATAVYRALEPKDVNNDMVYLTMGPWHHGQEIADSSTLGAIKWDQDTGKYWRHHVLAPFLAHYLKGTPMDVAPVTAFESGTNQWERLKAWPTVPGGTPLYLKPGMGLGFDRAEGSETADYLSDPAHPVGYRNRPNQPVGYDNNPWPTWLADDQRPVSSRPDVLTFTGEVLTGPVKIAGVPVVHLTASTSGTDSDWVVKLIDVYPDQVAGDRAMGGYQLAVGMDIFRGRYRESLAEAKPLAAGVPLKYEFALPPADHVFLPGHRIMVQVQSSWFPLYDRNPQSFVPNIFFAKPGDYVKATQKVTVAGPDASYIELPVVN
ncbi:MAG: glutaryl-7-ACA acylase [Sphingomonas bacterium]|uniref:CocE/NonD family hydrolase n=1 Tax=Sphingomonas bacterium TaxID=1895847 RepID=UPI00262C4FF2|nr:CocE/NonD family hydrolase [Sphingomonas bacterium]MDB5704549.1 glutaryl-7-ACA acylase [Sphingomonas bacterium]